MDACEEMIRHEEMAGREEVVAWEEMAGRVRK
jgi:hypothetical protein